MPRGSDIYKSPWLKAADLYGDDDEMTLTISRTGIHEFEDSRTRETKAQIILEFRELDDKKLGLNATNFRMLAAIFGSDESDDWIGHQVVLYVAQDRMPDGSTGDCIRVKKRATEKLRDARKAARPAKQPDATRSSKSPAPAMTQEEVDADDDIPFDGKSDVWPKGRE